jgi:eukaryotic-like serine/threonine-protein kinase
MNERAIFIGALEKQDPAGRLAYLTEACGEDTELRAHLDTLLREHDQLGGFLECPASGLAGLRMPAGGPVLQELGDYRILREIGRGGMGLVYEAEQVSLGRHVALKVLPAHSLLDRHRLQRFQREAKAAARLHHTNIVPIYGVGEQAGLHYFVMQFIVGQSLDQVLHALRNRQTTPLPLSSSGATYFREVARIGLQVAEALDYAARQGVLHRDIKPANLMLDEAGQMWVMDFGLAKITDDDDLTHSGELLGTLRFMAPERFQDRFDARSDVYSLGLTLYELLTLRPAYDEPDRSRLIARVLNEDPPRPSCLDRAIPRDLETIVLKAIAREPQGRYATAGDLAEDLRRFLADRPILARRVSAAERSWRWCRRNPAWAALMASVAVLGLAVVVISSLSALWLGERATQAEVAERNTREQLWISKRDQARALRMSRRPGQRIEALRVIAEAMRLPVPPDHSLAELRTEAIAALALPDIEVERTWQGGLTPGIVGVAFDRNLKHYARLAQDGTVTINRISDGKLVAHWHEDSPKPWLAEKNGLGFSPDGRYLYLWHAAERRLAIWRWGGAEPAFVFRRDDAGDGDAIGFTHDNTRLIYVVPDSRIAIVDLASGQARHLPWTGMKRPTIRCAPDGDRIAIGGLRAGKTTVEILDLTTELVESSLSHPAVPRLSLEWHTDGNTLVTASDDRKIRLWDVSHGKLLRTFDGHKNVGIRCAFDQTGARLLSNDWGQVLRLWEPSSGRQLLSLPAAGYNQLQVSPDDRLAAIPVADVTTLQVLRLHESKAYRSLASDLTRSGNVVVHPAGRLVAVGNQGPALLIDLATGREIGTLPAMETPFRWDSDGTLLTVSVWGVLSWPVQIDPAKPEIYRLGPPRRLWNAGPPRGSQCGGSADGRTFAFPFANGAKLIQLGSPSTIKRLDQEDVRNCSVSPNGKWVATGSHNSTDGFGASIWEAASDCLKPVKKLPVPKQCIPTFSPDGCWLMTNAGGCRLWRVPRKQDDTWADRPTITIGGDSACFSPDSRLLAVEDTPGTIRLVETETGTEIVRLESPEQSRLSPQCFSPDGTRLIASGHDTGSLHVWDLQLLRQELAPLGLDWSAPSYSSARSVAPAKALLVDVLSGELP